MKSPENFRSFYDSKMVPALQELDLDRKKLVNKSIKFTFIPLILSLIAVFFLDRMEGQFRFLIVLISGVLGAILFYGFNYKKIRELKMRFKSEVIAKMVKFIDESLHYEPFASITETQYRQSKLFLTGVDRYEGDDYVGGSVGQTRIEFSEIHSEYKTVSRDSKGNKRETWHTIFRGIFFIADFNKNFNGETIVLPDVAESTFGKLGSWFQKMNVSRDQLVKLEDPEFERHFCVYSNNQVEARYILSTKLMQRITEFKKKSHAKIHLSFVQSKIFIAISVEKNLFEPPFFSTMLEYNLIAEFFHYLHTSIGIVEELDLNTRIWTKE